MTQAWPYLPRSPHQPGCPALPLAAQGSWHADLCACICLNGANASLPGYCADSTGACTVVKTYDFSTKIWSCPADQDTADVPPSTGGTDNSSSAPSTGSTTGGGTSGAGTPPAGSSGAAPSTGTAVPAASTPSTTTSADVQPVGGVRFAFFLKGEVADFATKTDAVCSVLAALVGEAPATCTIVSVTETAAPNNSGARRLASTGGWSAGWQISKQPPP